MSAIILIGVFLVSPGFFSVDEAIYHLGARTIAEGGTLGLDNGYQQFRSESLKLRFLIDGPRGLTPQYPAGSALLAAPLLPLLGPRAFILLNALAAIATLFMVWKICLSQFKSEAVAKIAIGLLVAATFFMEYALGIWPHAISAFFAIQAYWFALRHLDSDDTDYRSAVLAGLFAGTGMLFRLDAILAVPAIGVMLALFARNPFRSLAWFGAGVLPPLALMSVFNSLKFGSLNPLSYGQSGGNTDLATYSAFLIALCLGFALLLLIRKRGFKVHRSGAMGAVAIVVLILIMLPPTRPWAMQFWNGLLALVIDIRAVDDNRQLVAIGHGETLKFFGLTKKALGQSMPWIGLLGFLLTSKIAPHDRRPIATLLIFIAAFTIPFIGMSWHGGGSSNMRYFLPIVPALCILCAKLITDVSRSDSNAIIFVALGIWGALGLGISWQSIHPSGFAGVQQIVPTYVLLATLLTAIGAGMATPFRQSFSHMTIALFAGGFVMAVSFASADIATAMKWRSMAQSVSAKVATLPRHSLVITRPEWVAAWLPGNGVFAAARDPRTEQVDVTLMEKALDAHYRVFLVEYDAMLDIPPGLDASEPVFLLPHGRAIELSRSAGTAGE